MAEYEPSLRTLPDKFLGQIIHILQTLPNETTDIGRPHLRASLEDVCPLYMVLYGAVMVAGLVGNGAMVLHILRRSLYRASTGAYLLNIGVCNLLMVAVLLPLSLAILLIQNWVFGSFLCYFVPMLQDVPLHVIMGTLVAVAGDRYRQVVAPHRPPIPPFPAVLATWVLAVCVVLPYALYMHYIDLQELLGDQFAGVGICTVNLQDDVTEYIHCLFIILFVLPLGVVAFLHVRVGMVLASMDDTMAPPSPTHALGSHRDTHARVWNLHHHTPDAHAFVSTDSEGREGRNHHQLPPYFPPPGRDGGRGGAATPPPPLHHHHHHHHHHLQHLQESPAAAGVEVAKEKRNQRYIVTMVTAFALCMCPLMILRLVKNMVMETSQNSAHFDLTFITVVWVAFLPTLTTPALYAAWKMSRPIKDRVLGYLRLCAQDRQYSVSSAHEMPPMYNSTCARTAHRLSLEPAHLPPSPHAHQHALGTPVFRPDVHQFEMDRVTFPS